MTGSAATVELSCENVFHIVHSERLQGGEDSSSSMMWGILLIYYVLQITSYLSCVYVCARNFSMVTTKLQKNSKCVHLPFSKLQCTHTQLMIFTIYCG